MTKDRVLRYDILKELFNISVGKSASMLSEIVNRKIILDVPDIKIFDKKNDNLSFQKSLPPVLDGTLMVSSISFREKLTGKANLIFPAKKMKMFINLCLNKNGEVKCLNTDFTDIDFDVVKEIGNIILNSIIGGIANYLNISLSYTLPKVKIFNRIDFGRDIESEEYNHALILYITFIIDDTEIQGALIVDLTLKSLSELIKKVDEIEDGLDG